MATFPQGSTATPGCPIDPRSLSYSNSNIDDIYIRQLSEDIAAYEFDSQYCEDTLKDPRLTPQETRTLQLRQLDLQHQIRHSRHRIEILSLQHRGGSSPTAVPRHQAAVYSTGAAPATRTGGRKRGSSNLSSNTLVPATASNKRARQADDGSADEGSDSDAGPLVDVETRLQRLGSWRCRLCTSQKYRLAGAGRVPAAPCKWMLKDISKMIVHFTEMHTEHEPAERCTELGAALDKNRGPFEYWLRRTRAQNIGDGVVGACIEQLKSGQLPNLLRKLSRAASSFPLEVEDG